MNGFLLADDPRRPLGALHPLSLTVEERMEPFSVAELPLPPHEEARPGQLVRLHGPVGDLGWYRVRTVERRWGQGGGTRLTLEHGLCTLRDQLIFGALPLPQEVTLGGAARRVLARQSAGQTCWRWDADLSSDALETVHLHEPLANMTLLDALLAIRECFPVAMEVCWRMDTFPWRIGIRGYTHNVMGELRLGRQARDVQLFREDAQLCTRLYPLGSGLGSNRLTIEGVNGGCAYLEDADAAARYGRRDAIWIDPTATTPEQLLGRAKRELARRSAPLIRLRVQASQWAEAAGDPADAFRPGRLCRLSFAGERGGLTQRVLALRHTDVIRRPGEVELVLGSQARQKTARILV